VRGLKFCTRKKAKRSWTQEQRTSRPKAAQREHKSAVTEAQICAETWRSLRLR
jgi:hypothetical protein